jgi:hypothetical protein
MWMILHRVMHIRCSSQSSFHSSFHSKLRADRAGVRQERQSGIWVRLTFFGSLHVQPCLKHLQEENPTASKGQYPEIGFHFLSQFCHFLVVRVFHLIASYTTINRFLNQTSWLPRRRSYDSLWSIADLEWMAIYDTMVGVRGGIRMFEFIPFHRT